MSIQILKKSKRIRSKKEMAHKPSGFGKGKWHSRTTLWKSRLARKKRNAVASASRAANR